MNVVPLVVLAVIALASAEAHAQEKTDYLLKKEQTNKRPDAATCKCTPPPPPPEPPAPWTFKLRVGSVFQLSQSSGMVGRLDGTTRSFNLDTHVEANWACGRHSLRNRLDTNDLIVKTQNTGRWVPAADFVEAESIYQYYAHPQAGPLRARGAVTLVQSIGGFVNPVKRPHFDIDLRGASACARCSPTGSSASRTTR